VEPLKERALEYLPKVQVAPLSVRVFPLPEESAEVEPDSSFMAYAALSELGTGVEELVGVGVGVGVGVADGRGVPPLEECL
jgi:hypothetical protein